MPKALLTNRSVIEISGADALDFLQGIISNDIKKLDANNIIYSALLSPQGKFLHDFFITKQENKLFLDVAKTRVDDLLSRLKLYRLRSKVEIIKRDDLNIITIWNEPSKNGFIDPRLPEMGYRCIVHQENFHELVSSEEYNTHRLELSIPDTEDMIVDRSLLMECGFDELNGVDFNKGCYVGQEVTARSKFRGEVRKSFYKVLADSQLPKSGTPIMLGEKIIGEIRSSQNTIGIAIVSTESYSTIVNTNSSATCVDIEIKISAPIWKKNS